jgi:hypothetical protein
MRRVNDPADANALRREIARVFDAPPAGRIVLAPGLLVALRLLLPALGVRTLRLGPDEYYDRGHFPGMGGARRPDAEIRSVVSWRGKILWMRRRPGTLLIADATHIGAAMFLPVRARGADIVCGDATKWIAPPDAEGRIAWLWFRSEALMARARRAFARLYLATDRSGSALCSRWVSPGDVRAALALLRRTDRRALLERGYQDFRLRWRLDTGQTEGQRATSILWYPGRPRFPRATLRRLESKGLVWRPPGGGVRILCRSDLVES